MHIEKDVFFIVLYPPDKSCVNYIQKLNIYAIHFALFFSSKFIFLLYRTAYSLCYKIINKIKKSRPLFKLTLPDLSSFEKSCGNLISYKLYNLDKKYRNYDGGSHDIGAETLVAVANGKVAQSSTPNCSSHC